MSGLPPSTAPPGAAGDGDVSWRGTATAAGVDPLYAGVETALDAARSLLAAVAAGDGGAATAGLLRSAAGAAAGAAATAAGAAAPAADAAAAAARAVARANVPFSPPDGGAILGAWRCSLDDEVAPTAHDLLPPRPRSLPGALHVTATNAYFVEDGGGGAVAVLPLSRVVGAAATGRVVAVDLGGGRSVTFAGVGGEGAAADAAAALRGGRG